MNDGEKTRRMRAERNEARCVVQQHGRQADAGRNRGPCWTRGTWCRARGAMMSGAGCGGWTNEPGGPAARPAAQRQCWRGTGGGAAARALRRYCACAAAARLWVGRAVQGPPPCPQGAVRSRQTDDARPRHSPVET